jgi:ligand-binding sensor domain-containing protein
LWKSGDADRVTLNGTGISVVHYDISSGPGVVAAEPQGREKICSVLRLAYHAPTQSVWFGGNHGVAWGSATSSEVVEHTHPAINGYVAVQNPDGTTSYHYTLLTDLYYGVAPLPNGDVWIGGANRSALFRWATLGKSFWSADVEIQKTMVDLWPDAVPHDAYPNQRVDDLVSDMAIDTDGTLWASSIVNGLVHYTPGGSTFLRDTTVEPNGKATALEVDPANGSLWVGFIWGGVTRLQGGVSTPYDVRVFGAWVNGTVTDIQSRILQGRRRVVVTFAGQAGVPAGVAVYTGP